mmetsp:Transcript_24813/g.45508  ORF Transcript_24813/g.45508 Transcript_24813/m.45508 type:complete len:652 (-) Transcript_24813:47-2002(-)
MGGASSSRSRFVGLPRGSSPGRGDGEGNGLGTNGEKFFGLVNVANTCYLNSVLQALYFCTPFRRLAIQHLLEEDASGDSLLVSLAELFAQIEHQKRSIGCITPRRFLQRVRKSNDLFSTAEHQDAHEFLQFLLNDIVEHLRKRMRKKSTSDDHQRLAENNGQEDEPRTWVHDIFQGMLVNQTRCLCCEAVTVRRETFFDLSVDIERHTSLAACLRAFESTELLRAGNKFFCEGCGCLQEAEKRLRICQLPSVLMLHLKRFKYVERLGRCCRLPYRVVFPLQLRVVEHRSHKRNGSRGQHVGGQPGNGADDKDGAANDNHEAPPTIRRFELRSVVVHVGRDSSRGHYVTVVRASDHYVLLDDDVVRVVEPELLRSFYGTANSSTSQPGHDRHHGHHHPNSWNLGEGGGHDMVGNLGDRYGSAAPSQSLYERAPEGTCCGYLLVYEAVGDNDHTSGENDAVDLSTLTEWISEDRHVTESDGSESGEDPPAMPDRGQQAEDIELTQAFEQRCVPKHAQQKHDKPATPQLGAAPGSPQGRAAQRSSAQPGVVDHLPQQVQSHSPPSAHAPSSTATNPHSGAFAWTSVEGDGSRVQQTSGAISSPHAVGMRTLGSVVPAAGGTDAVSPSKVNVVTVHTLSGAGASAISTTDTASGL